MSASRSCTLPSFVPRSLAMSGLKADGVQVADTLTLFALLHQALAHGGPLPPTMPIFERLAYHSTHQRPQGRSSGRNVSDRAGGSASADRSRTDVTDDDPMPDENASIDSTSRIWQEEQNVMLRMEDQLSWKTVQVRCHFLMLPR